MAFRYPFDVQSTLEPWRHELGSSFDDVVAHLSDRDRALEDYLYPGQHWTPYTPALTQSGAVAATVNYARYTRLGMTVMAQGELAVTGTGTASNSVLVDLPPVPAVQPTSGFLLGIGVVIDSSAAQAWKGAAEISGASPTKMNFLPTNGADATPLGTSSFTAALANGDVVRWSISYEAAS